MNAKPKNPAATYARRIVRERLVRDLISAACNVLQHDTDPLEGKEPHEVWAREQLETKFTEILSRHRIK